MLNQQGLFDDHEQELCGGAGGLFSCLQQNISTTIPPPPPPILHLNSLKTLTSNSPLALPQSNTPGIFLSFAPNPIHSSHINRSTTTNPWGWVEYLNDRTSNDRGNNNVEEDLEDCRGRVHNHRIGVSAVKMKKTKTMSSCGRRKVREPRFCFKTMTDVDVLDDGYKWRKYGQKVVKNTHHPR